MVWIASGLILVSGAALAEVVPDHSMYLQWGPMDDLKVSLAFVGVWMLCYAIMKKLEPPR